jgi:hypothetical protein
MVSSIIGARHLQLPPLVVDLPTVDIVVAYYNESIPEMKSTVTRLKSELTWAKTHVVVYHLGIPGYRESGTEYAGDGLPKANRGEFEETLDQFRKGSGADVVVPRRNVGRDMGVYLHHM